MRNLRITTYNTHLFLNTIAGIAADYEDNVRLEKLIWQLLKCQSDIVTLNEVWADSSKDKIIKGLFNKYPHSYYSKFKESPVKLGSGLLILSKFKIVNAKFTQYSHLTGSDDWSQKGFIQAEIVDESELLLRLIMTHTQSGNSGDEVIARTSNFKQIYDAIRAMNLSDKKPLLITGDFNVIAEYKGGAKTGEYTNIEKDFESLGLIDAYRTVNPNAKIFHGFTYNGFKNKLIPIFAPEDYNVQQRLDYIFMNQSVAKINIGKTDVSTGYLYSDPEKPQLMDISDHYPLNSVFSFD